MAKKTITRNNYKPSKGKKPKGKSLTIQNDVISIQQILQRYALGQPIEGKFNPVYIEDADHDDIDGQAFSQMDISEQQDILEGMKAMRTRLKNLEEEYKTEMKRRADEKPDPSKQAKTEMKRRADEKPDPSKQAKNEDASAK